MKRRSFLAVAAAVIAAPLAFIRKATNIAEPVRLKRILRWNPETRTCGIVCRMSELRCGDKFIMYQRDERMPKGKDTFYTAMTDPWVTTNEPGQKPGQKPGQWTIDAEWQAHSEVKEATPCGPA